jgi:hypothetical protein
MSEKRVINNWIKTYLIGAMSQTQANDCGVGWREKLTQELSLRIDQNENPIYIFNPCLQEQSKVGLNPKEFHQKVKGWLSSGNNDKVAEGSDLIWHGKTYIEEDEAGILHLIKLPGDYDYVENSDFLICKIDEGDRPCGTYFEAGYAMKLRKPLYVLQTMSREKYSESFVGWVFGSGGQFFENTNQLLEFVDKTYKLKVKNEI